MNSPTNDFPSSTWNQYPSNTGRLSYLRLVDPITPGFYGQPSGQLLISSNHQASLVNLGQLTNVATLALDGGGFPIEVAVAFGLIQKSQLDQILIDQLEFVEREVSLLIPDSLASAWKLKPGQIYLGSFVKIISDSFLISGSSPHTKAPGIIIRLLSALRLVLGQIFLVFLPVLIINTSSILWVILAFLLAALLLAGFWSIIPGNGWVKGVIIGATCAGIATLPVDQYIQTIINLPHLFPLGIFLAFVWMGGILTGARSLNH